MKNIAQTKVGKIVATNFRTSKVLTAYGIDFCCKGGITLEEACKNRNVPVEQVVSELEESFKMQDYFGYERMEPNELIHLIVSVHHKYVANTIPALETYLEKLCSVHGERHPELFQVRDLFSGAAEALTDHMQKEELILFPYIQAMAESKAGDFPLARPHFGDINNPIKMMEQEHDTEGERFREIARLSDNYTCPSDGCQTYWVAYALLKEFEEDLHKHIHLENNILFPQARKMFAEFNFDSKVPE